MKEKKRKRSSSRKKIVFFHPVLIVAHIKNVEFHREPLGQPQKPPVQFEPPTQTLLLQTSPAPAALKQVLVFTGYCGQSVQGCPSRTRSLHV